jgi:hypothetical protein
MDMLIAAIAIALIIFLFNSLCYFIKFAFEADKKLNQAMKPEQKQVCVRRFKRVLGQGMTSLYFVECDANKPNQCTFVRWDGMEKVSSIYCLDDFIAFVAEGSWVEIS